MRIANWNVERILPSERRLAHVREYLSSVEADIYVLTETHESLVPQAGFYGTFSGEPDRPSKAGEHWAAIWASSPLENIDPYVSDPARCVAAQLANTEIGEVVVYACVLPWGGSGWRGIASAGGKAFTAALEEYKRDWARLAADFPRATLIVAGDFNQDLAARHYYGSRIQREALIASLGEIGLTAVTAGDMDPIARQSPPYACIDHVCISRSTGMTIVGTHRWPDAAAPVGRLSDHFGVAVDVVRCR